MYFLLCSFLLLNTKTNALPADNAEMVLYSIKPLRGNYIVVKGNQMQLRVVGKNQRQ